MSLQDKVVKEFYYTMSVKFTDFFKDVETAALSERPSKEARVTVLDQKYNSARTKLNEANDEGVKSQSHKDSKGKAVWCTSQSMEVQKAFSKVPS